MWGLRRGERLILNVRSEGAATRFAEAYQRRRCVVPADGFYEWVGPPRNRWPTWFHGADGALLLMAGLFDAAPADPGAPPAFAVLTTASRPPVAAIHDRMPVLLSPDGARRWLVGEPPSAFPDDIALASRLVSARVNATAHDNPACLEARAPGAGGAQLRLF